MHFYQFNIGDYRRDTFHLSLLEHGIYRQLLDTYYLNEKPLAVDSAVVMRTHNARTKEEKAAVLAVLENFFLLTDEGWVHRRCEKTISAFHEKSEKARHSAESRWSKRNANAYQTQCEGNANQEPITNNQEPIKKEKKKTSATALRPTDVDETVWEDWIALRKRKNAVVSETVIKAAKDEAAKLNWSLEQFLREWCLRGSQGLKADWIKGQPKVYESAKDAGRRKVAEAILGKVSHDHTIIDIN